MFVCSMKASTIKFTAILVISIIALLTLVRFVPGYETAAVLLDHEKVTFDGIRKEDDRRTFAAQFGWEIALPAVSQEEVTVPQEFDEVYESYNTIQKAQGLDLSRYRGKTVMRETYTVTNYKDYDGTVYLNLLVYKNRVIGGDVCSAALDGFVAGFRGE